MRAQATDSVTVAMTVNGVSCSRTVSARTTLADFLREELELTGTKLGCEHGVCGACTVLIDGASARSCLTLAAQADGREVTTVEGLSEGRELNRLQASFRDHYGLQCGFCTAGFLVTATELLASGEAVDEARVREVLGGNLCRCTGYETIVAAVLDAADAGQGVRR
ncbi:MAG: (2Fe-2S)-binding protein [Actinobacteria bacterium]|nr:(2Fe-2S)-binding protein [Actinomycetota bacterium]